MYGSRFLENRVAEDGAHLLPLIPLVRRHMDVLLQNSEGPMGNGCGLSILGFIYQRMQSQLIAISLQSTYKPEDDGRMVTTVKEI
jgi:hypothetical protein